MKNEEETWFTIETIDDETFVISEYQHWEETHCYVLLTNQEAMVIGCGLGVKDIRKIVRDLTDLPATLLLTHAHWDHIGSLASFPNFMMHEAEVAWVTGEFPLSFDRVKKQLTLDNPSFPASFHLEQYQLQEGKPIHFLQNQEVLSFGGRTLQVLHTPGHSPGHVCFWEAKRGYLFSGDLVYAGCLDAFYPTSDPYAYWTSIQRIKTLPVQKILPGHHQLSLSIDLIGKIDDAFKQLDQDGHMKQGSGIFSFDGFSIHI